jgi:hypothetical protein
VCQASLHVGARAVNANDRLDFFGDDQPGGGWCGLPGGDLAVSTIFSARLADFLKP